MTEDLTKSLIVETDFEKIKRIQADILAFNSIFSLIEKSMIDATEAKKQLEYLQEE